MKRNLQQNASTIFHAAKSIQRMWRGYSGRKLIARIQLNNERDKLKNLRNQKQSKKKVEINKHNEENKILLSQDIPSLLSEDENVIVYKIQKKSSKLGSYDSLNYHPTKSFEKFDLQTYLNYSSSQLSYNSNEYNHMNKPYSSKSNEISNDFVFDNTGILSKIDEEDEILKDSLQNTAIISNNQSIRKSLQRNELNMKSTDKLLDSLELNLNHVSIPDEVDDINLEDSLNIQAKSSINTVPINTISSQYYPNNNIQSPLRKSLRIVKNENIIIPDSIPMIDKDINQPKVPSMQDLLALSPMKKSIPLLILSPNKSQNKLNSNVHSNSTNNTLQTEKILDKNNEMNIQQKSQLETAQELYESNVRKNFPRINPILSNNQNNVIHLSSPKKIINNTKINSNIVIDNPIHFENVVNRQEKVVATIQSNQYQSNEPNKNHYYPQNYSHQQQPIPSNNKDRDESIPKGYLVDYNSNKSNVQHISKQVQPVHIDRMNQITKPTQIKADLQRNFNQHQQQQQQQDQVKYIQKPSNQPPIIQLNEHIPQKKSNVMKKLPIPNKAIINTKLNQSTLHELQELKLLEEIEQLNKIQLQKMKELSLIEKQEHNHLTKDKEFGIDINKNQKNNEKRIKNKEINPLKEKEKKAFGPGARDIKPLKPSIIQEPSKPFSNIKRIINNPSDHDVAILSNEKQQIQQKQILNPLNEWKNALLKESNSNNDKIHELNELYHVGGIGYLQEYHKKRENKQRKISNPRGIRNNGYVDNSIYENNSIAKSEDPRLLHPRILLQKDQQLQSKRDQSNRQLEETMSLPTILPTRNIKSSNGIVVSSQYADIIHSNDIINDYNKQNIPNNLPNNRNTTMSAPSASRGVRMNNSNNNPSLIIPPLQTPLVLPSLRKVSQPLGNNLPILGMPTPMSNRKF